MNKYDILIAIKEIQCRYSLPAFEKNFTDKDYACKQYEKLVINLANQQEEKDKEIERLKAREQECIDKYLVESKYRSEVESKYVTDEYIINELEKYLEKIIIDSGTRGSMTFWYRQIYEYLQELKEGK